MGPLGQKRDASNAITITRPMGRVKSSTGDSYRPSPGFITVVIPVLNQARFLGVQVEALRRQSYQGEWELVVVDGGSSDGSLDVLTGWDRVDVPVTAVRTRRGLNHQRNVGARTARGDFIAFCDADDEAAEGWLDALARAARTADVIGGMLELGRLNPPRIRAWRDDEEPDGLELQHEFLPAIPGGNCGMWRDVALAVGWDERFGFGSSDIEFSWRAQLRSYRLAFAPDVVMHVRHRRTLPGLAYQWFRYGHSGARLYRAFRHVGMSRTPRREWLRDWSWLIAHGHQLHRAEAARAKWIRIAAFRIGRLVGSLGARVLFL